MGDQMRRYSQATRRAVGVIFAFCVSLAVAGSLASAQTYRMLEQQSNAEKARILRSLINSAGNPCSEVTTVMFRGADADQAGYWTVSCSDGGNWQVQVKNDAGGSSSVVSCDVLRAVNVDCWQKF